MIGDIHRRRAVCVGEVERCNPRECDHYIGKYASLANRKRPHPAYCGRDFCGLRNRSGNDNGFTTVGVSHPYVVVTGRERCKVVAGGI